MDFGVVFFGDVNVAPDVVLAEKHGFTHAWLYDSQMLASDVYAALALCAAKTKKIMLGPGVTNPASRIAPLTACSIASINAIAPGRAILGIGTGNTARRTLGMPAARLDVLRDHVRVCRDLLAGKTTLYQEGERRRMVKFLNPNSGAINIRKKIPIYVSASGPKTLELAGEIADGVILFGAVSPSLVEFNMSHIRKGAECAGRDPKKIYVLGMTAFHLTKEGEKLNRTRGHWYSVKLFEKTLAVRSKRSRASSEVEEQAERESGGLRLRSAALRPNGKGSTASEEVSESSVV